MSAVHRGPDHSHQTAPEELDGIQIEAGSDGPPRVSSARNERWSRRRLPVDGAERETSGAVRCSTGRRATSGWRCQQIGRAVVVVWARMGSEKADEQESRTRTAASGKSASMASVNEGLGLERTGFEWSADFFCASGQNWEGEQLVRIFGWFGLQSLAVLQPSGLRCGATRQPWHPGPVVLYRESSPWTAPRAMFRHPSIYLSAYEVFHVYPWGLRQ